MAAAATLPFFPPHCLTLDTDALFSDEMEGSLPPFNLSLDLDACISDEDTASPPLSTTSTQASTLICNENMEDSDPLAPVLVVDDQEEEPSSDDDVVEVTPPPPSSQPASQRSQRRMKDSNGTLIVVPNKITYPTGDDGKPDHGKNIIHALIHLHFHVIPDFQSLPTQVSSVKIDPSDLWANIELIGRYLIERGFPIIGTGSTTVVIQISDTHVAKVARYCRSVNKLMWERHTYQRNLDVLHSRHYPECFADTKACSVMPQHNPYFAFYVDIYVQELVKPVRWDKPDYSPYRNYVAILDMLEKNKQTQFKQWGLTLDERLVCYDYQ